MKDENIVYENINSKDDDEKFVLAPWGCLNCAFKGDLKWILALI